MLTYLPLTTAAMHQAALFWAQARQQGQPTADYDYDNVYRLTQADYTTGENYRLVLL